MERWVSGLALLLAGGCAASVRSDATGADAAQAVDAVTVDAVAQALDAAVAPPEPTFLGRWRAVRVRGALNDQMVEYADTTPLDGAFARRVNGVLIVGADRLRLNVGLFTSQGPVLSLSGGGDRELFWQHQLRAAEGRLSTRADGFTFEDTRVPGLEPLQFTLGEDGLLWMLVREPTGPRRTVSVAFARDPNPVRRDRVEMSASLLWRHETAPPDALTPVLFWDAPGAGSLEQRLRAAPWMGPLTRQTTTFALPLAGPPSAMFQGRVGGIPVAVAYPSAYVDLDGDNRFGPADGTRLDPPLAIVWRGEGPAENLRGTAFEGFLPGYSFALPNRVLVGDPDSAAGLVPFDNTHLPDFTLRSDAPADPGYRLVDFVP